MIPTEKIRIGVVGCGAIVELSHGPALARLAAAGSASVVALVDPDPARIARVAQGFPGARRVSDLAELDRGEIDLALVASPARFHAAQTIRLLETGVHVLCEKPLASTVAEAEAMFAAARKAGRLLAAGHFRRFFPALRLVRDYLGLGTLGRLQSIDIQEGGQFDWPAATPSFFDRRQAGGGVWLDAGIHVLDTLAWWLGEPAELAYADDSAGGLEANCRVRLRYADGVTCAVFLSRDFATAARWQLDFERARIVWRVGRTDELEIRLAGSKVWQIVRTERETAAGRRPGDSYDDVFVTQLADVIEAIRSGQAPAVSGADALPALRAVERGYRDRGVLECPWMSAEERVALRAARNR
jgi:predicted dehydrogenase